MAINRKNGSNENKENKEAKFKATEIKVLRVKDNGNAIVFDMQVNGIKIYGCWYREGVKDGKEWALIDLPSRKSEKDGNYYSIVWFPITKEFVAEVAKQIEDVLE